MVDIKHNVPEFFYISETPVVFKTNVKNENNEDVWICSIVPTAMIFLKFYAVFLFVLS